VYSSEYIDDLTLLSLDDALKTAYTMRNEDWPEESNANAFHWSSVLQVFWFFNFFQKCTGSTHFCYETSKKHNIP